MIKDSTFIRGQVKYRVPQLIRQIDHGWEVEVYLISTYKRLQVDWKRRLPRHIQNPKLEHQRGVGVTCHDPFRLSVPPDFLPRFQVDYWLLNLLISLTEVSDHYII